LDTVNEAINDYLSALKVWERAMSKKWEDR
jgi:hypothetical protein